MVMLIFFLPLSITDSGSLYLARAPELVVLRSCVNDVSGFHRLWLAYCHNLGDNQVDTASHPEQRER